MPTDALSFGKKAQKISDISVPFYPALHPQNPRSIYAHVPHALDQFVLKIYKKIVLYHWDSPNTRNGSRLRSSSPITAPVVFCLSPVFFGYNPEKNTRFYARNNSSQRFSIPKMYSVSLKLLKQQFNFQMVLVTSKYVPESSPSTPTTTRKFYNFVPNDSNDVFYDKKRGFRGVFEIYN